MRKNAREKNSAIIRISLLTGILLMLVATTGVNAQSYVGVRAGYGMGSARIFPEREMQTLGGMMSAGISYKYFSDMRFVGAIQADLQYFQRGFKYDLIKDSDTSYQRRINSIELPLMWHPHFYIFNRKGRVFMNLGLNLSYNLNSTFEETSKKNGVLDKGDYEMKLVRDNRWGYGLVGGFGVSFFYDRFEFLFEGRYYYGYSDILKNHNKYVGNPLRSPLDNINFSIGVYYRLGEGGIKAPPSKRMAAKLAAFEAERILKAAKEDSLRLVDSVALAAKAGELKVQEENIQTSEEELKAKKQKGTRRWLFGRKKENAKTEE